MAEITREQWEAIPDTDTTPLTVTANIYTSVFHDHVEHEVTWTGTKAEIEQQAAWYATVEMADYPLLHMEIDTVEVLDE